MSFHVVITGSRHWKNVDQIRERLSALKAEHGDGLEIAHGKSPGGGVDLHVESICYELGIAQTPFPKLPRDGNHRGAYLNRNRRMVLAWMPDLVLAFRSEGTSNGTDHTLSVAEELGYPTEIVKENTYELH